MRLFDFLPKREPRIPPHVIETIQRQVTILTESADLVNSSKNLDVVIRRLNIVLSSINTLEKYSEREFKAAGYNLKGSLIDTAKSIIDHRTQFVNQGIERNIRSSIDSVKTKKGKINKLESLYKEISERQDLNQENISFLMELHSSLNGQLHNGA